MALRLARLLLEHNGLRLVGCENHFWLAGGPVIVRVTTVVQELDTVGRRLRRRAGLTRFNSTLQSGGQPQAPEGR